MTTSSGESPLEPNLNEIAEVGIVSSIQQTLKCTLNLEWEIKDYVDAAPEERDEVLNTSSHENRTDNSLSLGRRGTDDCDQLVDTNVDVVQDLDSKADEEWKHEEIEKDYMTSANENQPSLNLSGITEDEQVPIRKGPKIMEPKCIQASKQRSNNDSDSVMDSPLSACRAMASCGVLDLLPGMFSLAKDYHSDNMTAPKETALLEESNPKDRDSSTSKSLKAASGKGACEEMPHAEVPDPLQKMDRGKDESTVVTVKVTSSGDKDDQAGKRPKEDKVATINAGEILEVSPSSHVCGSAGISEGANTSKFAEKKAYRDPTGESDSGGNHIKGTGEKNEYTITASFVDPSVRKSDEKQDNLEDIVAFDPSEWRNNGPGSKIMVSGRNEADSDESKGDVKRIDAAKDMGDKNTIIDGGNFSKTTIYICGSLPSCGVVGLIRDMLAPKGKGSKNDKETGNVMKGVSLRQVEDGETTQDHISNTHASEDTNTVEDIDIDIESPEPKERTKLRGVEKYMAVHSENTLEYPQSNSDNEEQTLSMKDNTSSKFGCSLIEEEESQESVIIQEKGTSCEPSENVEQCETVTTTANNANSGERRQETNSESNIVIESPEINCVGFRSCMTIDNCGACYTVGDIIAKEADGCEDLREKSQVTRKEESSPLVLRGACGTSGIVQDIFSSASGDIVDLEKGLSDVENDFVDERDFTSPGPEERFSEGAPDKKRSLLAASTRDVVSDVLMYEMMKEALPIENSRNDEESSLGVLGMPKQNGWDKEVTATSRVSDTVVAKCGVSSLDERVEESTEESSATLVKDASLGPTSQSLTVKDGSSMERQLLFGCGSGRLFHVLESVSSDEDQSLDELLEISDLSDLSRDIWIVTTAALPWRTGTAVNPFLRALYLVRRRLSVYNEQNSDVSSVKGGKITLVVPWLEDIADVGKLFGGIITETGDAGKQQQLEWMKKYAAESCGMEDEMGYLNIMFYPAAYYPGFGSIFPTVDICSLIPDSEADVAILEEPEHLNWFRIPATDSSSTFEGEPTSFCVGQSATEVRKEAMESTKDSSQQNELGWAHKFNFVVGIIHTNYAAYMKQYGIGSSIVAAPAISAMSKMVVRAYCHKVVRLSGVIPTYAKWKETTCNVHGVREEFLRRCTDSECVEREKNNSNCAPIYFIGKLLWAKGFDRMLKVQEAFRTAHPKKQYFPIDVYGAGPDDTAIKRAFLGRYRSHVEGNSSTSCQGALGVTESEDDTIPEPYSDPKNYVNTGFELMVLDESRKTGSNEVVVMERRKLVVYPKSVGMKDDKDMSTVATDHDGAVGESDIKELKLMASFSFDPPKSMFELRREPLPARFLGVKDHAQLRDMPHKVFLNPSVTEVLCTTTAEALAMGKFVIIPKHPSNEFFLQFPNCLAYKSMKECVEHIQWALNNDPTPLTEEQSYIFTWHAATDRLIEASIITKREARSFNKSGLNKGDSRMAWVHSEGGKKGLLIKTTLFGDKHNQEDAPVGTE